MRAERAQPPEGHRVGDGRGRQSARPARRSQTTPVASAPAAAGPARATATTPNGTRNHVRFSASMYWIARYVHGEHRERAPSGSSACEAMRASRAEDDVRSGWAATAKISMQGTAQTAMMPSDRSSTGRVSRPSRSAASRSRARDRSPRPSRPRSAPLRRRRSPRMSSRPWSENWCLAAIRSMFWSSWMIAEGDDRDPGRQTCRPRLSAPSAALAAASARRSGPASWP